MNESAFPDPLNTTYVSPRFRKLTSAFRYLDPVEGTIICRVDLLIDGASFGRWLAPFFGDQHDYDIPATPHDQLYFDNRVYGKPLSRLRCDQVLYRAMKAAGFGTALATTFFLGVRVGGWRSWRKSRKQDHVKFKSE